MLCCVVPPPHAYEVGRLRKQETTYRFPLHVVEKVPYLKTLCSWNEQALSEEAQGEPVNLDDPLWHCVFRTLEVSEDKPFYIPELYTRQPFSLLNLFEKVFESWTRAESVMLMSNLVPIVVS